jgi:hypothetical protein
VLVLDLYFVHLSANVFWSPQFAGSCWRCSYGADKTADAGCIHDGGVRGAGESSAHGRASESPYGVPS